MIALLIFGGILTAAAGAIWLVLAEVQGWPPPPPWTGRMIAGGLAAAVLGWILQWTGRRLQKFFRRRCIQCGRDAVKGSIYCGPHLREATTLQRERSELDRL
jgi:type VI protein secretion system component VasK